MTRLQGISLALFVNFALWAALYFFLKQFIK
jgi:hypothetical protein